MKTVFISNYFNHHQKCFSEYLSVKCEYNFISTTKMRKERKELGYGADVSPKYVINYSENKSSIAIDNADVIIIGSAHKRFEKKALSVNKLIFKYSERPFKKGIEPLKYLPRLIKWNVKYPAFKPIYLLCASAYASLDYSKLFMFRNRAYKWGYFPETKVYNIDNLLIEKKPTEILWCGRFIDWKHPDDAVRAITMLKKDGYNIVLKFIGIGVMENQLKNMVKECDVEENVIFLGAMTPEKVREHMEKAGIYLFTSDRQEGWGAVLNESMNSACAVVASHLIGSVPFLIKNNENGLVYESGNIDMLYQKIKFLLDNPKKQQELGKNAYETIATEWNAEVAAERFINLAEHILEGDTYPDLYKSGPCSRAEIIKESWFEQ